MLKKEYLNFMKKDNKENKANEKLSTATRKRLIGLSLRKGLNINGN